MPAQKNATKRTANKRKAGKTSPSRNKRETGLNHEQQAFVDEMLTMDRMNATQAYMRVYKIRDANVAAAAASRLLRLVKVQKALEAGMEARIKRTEFTQDKMFNRLLAMMTADVNDIVEWRRENCRHCHGIDHKFQWVDEDEYERACAAIDRELEPGQIANYPDNAGGFGFDDHALPHPSCPKCGGEGHGRQFIHDTRFLTGGARMLYAGIKQTKEGIEAKIHDQKDVARLLMQHMGMLDPKLTLKGDSESPVVALLMGLSGNTIKPTGEGD